MTHERVAGPMRRPVSNYSRHIREVAGDNALSLTLFGSIAAGVFDIKQHTVRNILVLRSADLDLLRRLAKEGVKFGKDRIAAPLIMTPEYIQASLDTFPLELLEIMQCRLVLFGDDYFDNLALTEGHLRLGCEREFKLILVEMRQGLLAAAGREKLFSTLEANVAQRLVRTFRGMLWLKGIRDPRPAPTVISDIEKIINRPLPGVLGAIHAPGTHGFDDFRTLYIDVEALSKTVDAW